MARRIRETPREKLARMLRDEGFDIEARQIISAEGYHRIYGYLDDTTVCWESVGATHVKHAPYSAYLHSYCPITQLVKNGFTYTQDGTFFEFFPKEKEKPDGKAAGVAEDPGGVRRQEDGR